MPPGKFCWGHCYLVRADGGARSDFVTAWLSHLETSQTLKTQWTIAVRTGQTRMHLSCQTFDRAFFKQETDTAYLDWILGVQQRNAPLIAQKTHSPYVVDLLPAALIPYTTLINVIIELDDLVDIVWEFFAKTYLSRGFNPTMLGFMFPADQLEKVITDQDKVQILEIAMKKTIEVLFVSTIRPRIVPNTTLDIKNITYKDVVSTQGSYILTDLLNIEVSNTDHAAWAKAIPMAVSPVVVDMFGKTWAKSDLYRFMPEQ